MKNIITAWNWLKGKKTYIISFATVVYGWGIQENLWPHYILLDFALGGTGLAAVRHGVSSAMAQVITPPQVLTSVNLPPEKIKP